MGPLALAGASVVMAVEKIRIHRLVIQAASTLVILLVLGALTFHQSAKYHDLISLYQATLAQNPKCWMAEYNLGLALKNQGGNSSRRLHTIAAPSTSGRIMSKRITIWGAPISKKESSMKPSPNIGARSKSAPMRRIHIIIAGSALRELKQFDQAEAEYKRALSLRPQYLDARLNLGSLLLQRGRTAEAIVNLENARRLQPNDATTHVSLALALMKNGQASKAAAEFNHALQLAPDKVNALIASPGCSRRLRTIRVHDGERAVRLAERANVLAG